MSGKLGWSSTQTSVETLRGATEMRFYVLTEVFSSWYIFFVFRPILLSQKSFESLFQCENLVVWSFLYLFYFIFHNYLKKVSFFIKYEKNRYCAKSYERIRISILPNLGTTTLYLPFFLFEDRSTNIKVISTFYLKIHTFEIQPFKVFNYISVNKF